MRQTPLVPPDAFYYDLTGATEAEDFIPLDAPARTAAPPEAPPAGPGPVDYVPPRILPWDTAVAPCGRGEPPAKRFRAGPQPDTLACTPPAEPRAESARAGPAREEEEGPALTDAQRVVVDRALAGQSFFFTGAAGTGKSFVLRRIARALKAAHGRARVYVTATTGLAAAAVGGCTLHAAAGLGLALDPAEDLCRKVRRRWKDEEPLMWRDARALIVDECSMLAPDLFGKFEEVARAVRGSSEPFGGLQVILCGDFYQLPPVFRAGEERRYVFETPAWESVVGDRSYKLVEIHRQKDARLRAILLQVRNGCLTAGGRALLERRQEAAPSSSSSSSSPSPERSKFVSLYSTRREVDEINRRALAAIDGEERTFLAHDTPEWRGARAGDEPAEEDCHPHLKDVLAPRALTLKVGARVMLIKNMGDSALFNGSTGVVTRFVEDHGPVVLFDSGAELQVHRHTWTVEIGGKEVASRRQYPLILAYALTIHKAQGMSIEHLSVDLSRVFECAQAYVALSRAVTLEGLVLRSGLPPDSRMRPDRKVVDFYSKMHEITRKSSFDFAESDMQNLAAACASKELGLAADDSAVTSSESKLAELRSWASRAGACLPGAVLGAVLRCSRVVVARKLFCQADVFNCVPPEDEGTIVLKLWSESGELEASVTQEETARFVVHFALACRPELAIVNSWWDSWARWKSCRDRFQMLSEIGCIEEVVVTNSKNN
eukprot:m51a1_g2135 putative atp-dependent dna helicase pif1-like (718) ;mRNA; r:1712605-1715019